MIKQNLWLIPLIILSIQAHLFAQEDVIKKELETQQQRLKSLQKEISTHQKKAYDIESSKQSLIKELTELDEKIALQWEILQKTRQDWTRKELALIETQKDYSRQKQSLNMLKLQIEHRLRMLREMGQLGSLNILFATESPSELLARETYLRLILDHDKEQRQVYRSRLKELAESEIKLEKQKIAFKEAADEIEAQALLLEERKREKQNFLHELKQQGRLYTAMLKELKSAEQSLQDIIKCLIVSKREEKFIPDTASSSMYNFKSQKGKLNPPVSGKLSRTMVNGWRNDKTYPGIIFSTPRGSEIRAIFDGTVKYNNIIPGYGRVLIIDHGDKYFSLVSQGAQFFKTVGQRVTEGDIIGLSGGGPWIQEGIYFEIRHGEKQEDPLQWFDPRSIDASRQQ